MALTARSQSRTNLAVEIKEDGSIVTRVDKALGNFLTHRFRKYIPGSQIMDEESIRTELAMKSPLLRHGDYTWIVDPLDGTEPFRNGGDFAIMACLRKNRQTLLAWIYYPRTNDMFFASLAKKQTLYFSNVAKVRKTKVIKSISKKPPKEITLALSAKVNTFEEADLQECFLGKRTTRRGSLALHEMLLQGVCGVITPKVRTPWDYLPLDLIIRMAGGSVKQLNGSPYHDRATTFAGMPTDMAMRMLLSSTRPLFTASTSRSTTPQYLSSHTYALQ